jgi:aryl-alcohol dehydrogenase-like predicted oxidoreductase
MRLSTDPKRDDERSVAVIRAALDAGVTLLDTSDAYCLDDRETGHNERLIARALAEWNGDRTRITVATKGGIRRPKGAWINDGRAKHLRNACEASRQALGVDTIDLYQLHAVDPKTPFETSVRALARLKEEGKVRDVGLCNVTVNQIRAAQAIVPIASVQASLSPLDDESLRNGVAEYCRDNGIRLIAYRPLGGERIARLERNAVLSGIAARHGASVETIVLVWLVSFGGVVPIPGATHVETAGALSRVSGIVLDEDDRRALDQEFSGRLLRVPRAQRRPKDDAEGDVVLVMGMPGSGKTTIARELESKRYERLNRDTLGGSLADLVPRLDELLVAGRNRVVLDNTYPSRKSRNEVIETAWQHGVPVRCIWQTTSLADAQINSIRRMIEVHGSLPTPDEIRALNKSDARYLLPDAQFRYERVLERPAIDEGFTSIEERAFVRKASNATARALILDFDDLLGTPGDARRDVLARYRNDGWLFFVHAWRPNLERSDDCHTAIHEALGADVAVACCTHEAGPPVCWCRKPIPGSVIEFSMRRDVDLTKSIVVGTSSSDRTLAERIEARFETSTSFFG